ncbi:MAG: sulfotransferase family protein [Phycisphaeraceae bacterium JB051]
MADLAQYVQQLTPVFITAPTARNGVTLLQRLINSSKQMIVYGENTNFMSVVPKLVHSSVQVHNERSAEFNEARKQFLEQTTEGWTSNLWPDPQPLMMVAFEAFYKSVLVYQQCSEKYGYQRWGIKNPLNEPQMIERLRILMPKARYLFIYRNPIDVIKSAKSRKFITTTDQLKQYAAQWAGILTTVVNYGFEQVKVIKYENLISNPDPIIDQIERFAGITGIDRSVMNRKINTFAVSSNVMEGTNTKGYVKPDDLSTDEKKMITDIAGNVMQQFGYSV